MSKSAKIHLVGAGPGDPDLMTVKARRLLDHADVVVYDRLVSEAVLKTIPAGTARIFVGKADGNHSLPQDEINDLLVRLASNGHIVVRLKGGDPFIFGRGGEEALHLKAHGVPFEIVPGITAASGIGADLGLPLTHRGLATDVRFITGHLSSDRTLDLDWGSLSASRSTLIFYMGLATLPDIAERLVAAGLPASTPAAAVAKGTVAGQRQCTATLDRLPALVTDLRFEAPVLVIIGQVVALAGLLDWQGLAWETGQDEAADGMSIRA